MEAFVDFAKMLVGYVCINLSCADVGMTEKGLDGANIGAVHEKVGSKTMTKGVWGDFLGNASLASIFLNNAFDTARSKTAIIARGRWHLLVLRIV